MINPFKRRKKDAEIEALGLPSDCDVLKSSEEFSEKSDEGTSENEKISEVLSLRSIEFIQSIDIFDIIRNAHSCIVLIKPYIERDMAELLMKRANEISVIICVEKNITANEFKGDLTGYRTIAERYNRQLIMLGKIGLSYLFADDSLYVFYGNDSTDSLPSVCKYSPLTIEEFTGLVMPFVEKIKRSDGTESIPVKPENQSVLIPPVANENTVGNISSNDTEAVKTDGNDTENDTQVLPKQNSEEIKVTLDTPTFTTISREELLDVIDKAELPRMKKELTDKFNEKYQIIDIEFKGVSPETKEVSISKFYDMFNIIEDDRLKSTWRIISKEEIKESIDKNIAVKAIFNLDMQYALQINNYFKLVPNDYIGVYESQAEKIKDELIQYLNGNNNTSVGNIPIKKSFDYKKIFDNSKDALKSYLITLCSNYPEIAGYVESTGLIFKKGMKTEAVKKEFNLFKGNGEDYSHYKFYNRVFRKNDFGEVELRNIELNAFLDSFIDTIFDSHANIADKVSFTVKKAGLIPDSFDYDFVSEIMKTIRPTANNQNKDKKEKMYLDDELSVLVKEYYNFLNKKDCDTLDRNK